MHVRLLDKSAENAENRALIPFGGRLTLCVIGLLFAGMGHESFAITDH